MNEQDITTVEEAPTQIIEQSSSKSEQQNVTTDQILSIVINTLFDIPENSQIQVPYESIVKRITLLKQGFMQQEEREKIQGLFKKLEEEKNSLLSELKEFREVNPQLTE